MGPNPESDDPDVDWLMLHGDRVDVAGAGAAADDGDASPPPTPASPSAPAEERPREACLGALGLALDLKLGAPQERVESGSLRPVAKDRWMVLGQCHRLGLLGHTVDVELTLRDQQSTTWYGRSSLRRTGPQPISLSERVRFGRDAVFAPLNTVFLNVYDLLPELTSVNQLLCNSVMKTFGGFHATVEVYGEEWGFYQQPEPDISGVCISAQPRQHPVHCYRQSINLGQTHLLDYEVWNTLRWDVVPHWPSKRYDILHCNCIHFADHVLPLLGVAPVPSWVRGLHETGAAAVRIWPLSLLLEDEAEQDQVAPHPIAPEAPQVDVSAARPSKASGDAPALDVAAAS